VPTGCPRCSQKKKKASFNKWKKEPSEENKKQYQKGKKKMKSEAEKELDEIGRCKNAIFEKIRMIKKDSNDIAGGDCLKDVEGRIVSSDED